MKKDMKTAISNLIFYGSCFSIYLFGYIEDVWGRKKDYDRYNMSKPLYYVILERFKYSSYVNLVTCAIIINKSITN